jgi:hypothetical protein
MLQVQEYLENQSLQDLELEHGVNHRFSADRTKFSLNYDQLAAKSDNPIACQCRGLVLRPIYPQGDVTSLVGPTEVVARPMDRFFNAGDFHAAPIDWSTAVIQCKLDGTMTELYWDSVKEQWCVGTRSVPEADVSFGDIVSPLKENTFYELFMYAADKTLLNRALLDSVDIEGPIYGTMIEAWKAEPTILENWLNSLDKSFTYVFELTSPLNRVVVKYDDYRITILAARETATGKYIPTDDLYKIGVPVVETWPLKTLADIEAFLHGSDPAKIEGAVVIDANHNRLKVKSKQWVLASRAKDMVTISKRNALECVIDGTVDDVLPLLAEDIQDYLLNLQRDLATYCNRIDAGFRRYRLQPDRKSFALNVQASGEWQTPFFNLYSGQWKTTSEWLVHLCKAKKMTAGTLDVLLENLNKIREYVEQ